MFFAYQTRMRIEGKLPEQTYLTYSKLLIAAALCWLVLIGFLFIPDYFAPFIIIPLILSGVCDTAGTIILSTYFVSAFALIKDISANYVIEMLMLVALGAIVSIYLKSRAGIEKLFALIIVFAAEIMITVVMYYIDKLEVNNSVIINAFICGIISVVFGAVVPFLFDSAVSKNNETAYDDLIVENYSLIEDIRRFSYYEFVHARRVMRLSKVAAKCINANEGTCQVAGMYYRLGKVLGEPEIDNAVKCANDHCFPKPVIDILYEYNGIIKKPSTRESAIVQMVDSVVTKIELLDRDSMSSSWNQNMVIYQTINEMSESGMYDESGLSMNSFLKVRDALTKEDILA